MLTAFLQTNTKNSGIQSVQADQIVELIHHCLQ